jgi:hypothetical protein
MATPCAVQRDHSFHTSGAYVSIGYILHFLWSASSCPLIKLPQALPLLYLLGRV